MPGRFIPPDPSRGDPNTIGGYMAVHGRPAAFEGPDGYSYSVELTVDETGKRERPFGAFFLFMRWRRMGEQGVQGHLESDFLAFGESASEARDALGQWALNDVKRTLDGLVRERTDTMQGRRWWDAMREEE